MINIAATAVRRPKFSAFDWSVPCASDALHWPTSLGLAVASVATPAFAEGSWHSYLDKVLPGFDSRTWRDGNVDANSTNIGFTNCNGAAIAAGGRANQLSVSSVDVWY